ncbi:hypothetical protein [Streptomyces hoynatensis]|uniref:Uncharacterized protein n=1 Tax=Streptomyces hoynatensis TaxID=1141874 RepID=A0A3A9Z4L6_9ACTN|nr:hypothetical protein [Streptomyces hoynatensis]RKN42999.1 hypothetical protein D7294_10785 [Streptomyces hoynatensis]
MIPVGRPAGDLPDLDRLTPAQQMGIACVRCGRRLGASGLRLGLVRDRWGHVFILWACAPHCPVGTTFFHRR